MIFKWQLPGDVSTTCGVCSHKCKHQGSLSSSPNKFSCHDYFISWKADRKMTALSVVYFFHKTKISEIFLVQLVLIPPNRGVPHLH